METIPADLRKVLAANAKAKVIWNDLTPISRRDFISWIESPKQPETRIRRVGRVCDMLISGKRRPCCYAIVPMNLYKSLNGLPKAKAHWKTLTPDERRDFVDWIESAKDTAMHVGRIEKVCVLLLKGKRHL
ncbi:MAG: hypothetical protein AB203_02740 [Parcubacteria bacterium C7867-008]|nr:MAG: hypothetical protein AB203_02740 [Parcubacteria bacterium C7867-008]